MKILIGKRHIEGEETEIAVGVMHNVTIRECYLGIAIETDQGTFGIAQRDNGIEVLLNRKLVWTSMDLEKQNPPTGEKEN